MQMSSASNAGANVLKALLVPALFDLSPTEQIGANSPAWFLRQREGGAGPRHPSGTQLLFPPLSPGMMDLWCLGSRSQ